MKKLNRKELLDWANEKRKTARLYQQFGLWRFARDETRHAHTFKKMAVKIK